MARATRPIIITPDIERRMEKYTSRNSDSGCWEWTGYVGDEGYGRFAINSRPYFAHRVSYTRHKGAIPDGLVIDHLCRNRQCINPEHLEPVTFQLNVLRGESPGAKAQRRDKCLRGHSYASYGRQYYGRRYCSACGAIHVSNFRNRRKQAS